MVALAAFERGRDLVDQARVDEATVELKAAVAADPDFALATAYLGMVTRGPEGDALIDKAGKLAAPLPAAEKLMVAALAAARAGDTDKAAGILRHIAELAPGDWRTQLALAQHALGAEHFDDAIHAAEKATAMHPAAATAYNVLAYAYAGEHKFDPAIAAARKQSALLPADANPLDTLGEIQVAAGQFADAETSFKKALTLAPRFATAWQGIAISRFYRGDWQGGQEALASGEALLATPAERLDWDDDVALAKAAEGKVEEAIALTAAVESQAETLKRVNYVSTVNMRAFIYYWQGQYNLALRDAVAARERLDKTPWLAKIGANQRRRALLLETLALAKQGHVDDAVAALGPLVEDSRAHPDDANLASNVAWAHGAIALAKGDAQSAVKAMSACAADAWSCRYELSLAEDKAGESVAAAETRKQILGYYSRDTGYLLVSTKLGVPVVPARPAKPAR